MSDLGRCDGCHERPAIWLAMDGDLAAGERLCEGCFFERWPGVSLAVRRAR
jgi:hypothetical protein